jgi:hypothetical protein
MEALADIRALRPDQGDRQSILAKEGLDMCALHELDAVQIEAGFTISTRLADWEAQVLTVRISW